MRRVILAIALCLLLGVATTVALAWAVALELGNDFYVGAKGRINDDWFGAVEHDVFARKAQIRRITEQRSNRVIDPEPFDVPAPFASLIEPPYSDDYVAARGLMAGVPFPSFYYIRRLDAPYVFIEEWDYTNHGALRGFNPFEDANDPEAQAMYLPLLPYWPGMLGSAVVVALGWLVFPLCGYGIRITRASLRRKRSRCAFCKHVLHEEPDRCSECGRSRSARQPLVTRRANILLGGVAFLSTVAIIGFALTFRAHDPVAPIIRASYEGDAKRVRELLAEGADADIVEQIPAHGMGWAIGFDISPVMAAAASGDLETMDVLLQSGADPKVALNGVSAIGVAADALHFDICDLLIAHGADPNLQIGPHSSPLLLPVISGNLEAVRELIQRGANPSISDTAVLSAFTKHNGYMIDLLVEHGAKVEMAMFAAVRYGDLKRFEQYLECGADPSWRTNAGSTYLMTLRAESYNESIFEQLIEAGVEVNARTASGHTALMNAAYSPSPPAVLLLLRNGAEPNHVDDSGDTALSLAAEFAQFEMRESELCILYLLAFHADPTIITGDALLQLSAPLRETIQAVQRRWNEFDARQDASLPSHDNRLGDEPARWHNIH